MSLSFEQKLAIFEDSQYGMERYSIKPNKTNFRYKGKVIVREMREGSPVAYVWGKDIAEFTDKYKIDERGWILVHDFTENEIRDLLVQVLLMRDKLTMQKNNER
ncbi:hypothetical protein KZ483_26070 [Paenibacillus sp. sptzw28]|uniref:hypothetical protein n=1 Tax=Paenibacillus sp. sptzw28 TaxID=715179 RepID=UPI001C6F0106|nr:hypothetical protein [Paenibacillus sp. sptzw28]QYR21134.1 hypothetical protein KZ483_26070 [Paenibacillus sp. sptzw28]